MGYGMVTIRYCKAYDIYVLLQKGIVSVKTHITYIIRNNNHVWKTFNAAKIIIK